MRLREAFSSVVSSWLLFCQRGQISKPRISSMLREFMPRSNKTVADGLAVAVVLTLEFAEIASVRVHLDHVASLIVDANHCIVGTAESAK
jgi:hypothetical protein